jgi:hypothetical protein
LVGVCLGLLSAPLSLSWFGEGLDQRFLERLLVVARDQRTAFAVADDLGWAVRIAAITGSRMPLPRPVRARMPRLSER